MKGLALQRRGIAFVVACALVCTTQYAKALDYTANDYVLPPAGTNVFIQYYFYNDFTHYNSAVAEDISHSHLDVNTSLTRFTHFDEVFGIPYAATVALPAESYSGGEIAGQKLNDAAGIGDLEALLFVWLVNDPSQKQHVVASITQSFPTGEYEASKSVSLGANRYESDFQLEYQQGLWNHVSFDIAGDYVLYTDNNDANALRQKLTQRPSEQAYVWLDYDTTKTSFIAVGWSASFGGKALVNGIYNGTKADFQQIRLAGAFRPSPTVQLMAQLSRDVYTTGGFQQGFGLQLRLVKAF